jgi:hypothetical protein
MKLCIGPQTLTTPFRRGISKHHHYYYVPQVSLVAPAVRVNPALQAKPAPTRPRDVVAEVQFTGPTELAMAVQAGMEVVPQ